MAQLLNGTTIDGNVAFHTGNFDPSSVKGMSDSEKKIFNQLLTRQAEDDFIRTGNDLGFEGAIYDIFVDESKIQKLDKTKILNSNLLLDQNEYDITQFSLFSEDFSYFSVAAQEANPFGMAFKPDGTKMYISGSSGREVNPYTLGTPWDVTTASFDGTPFSVSAQETNPRGMAFKPDGTKMYIVGNSGDDVNPYTLSTPWDVTTASFDGTPFSVAAQETSPYGIAFKPDGTKMYIVGTAGDDVNPYTLGTPWDVTTATFDGTPFSVAAQDTYPVDISFKPDGTKMYIVGNSGDDVNPYTLSTPWDVTTASFDGTPFSVAAQETSPYGIAFKPDGTKMYIVGTAGDNVNSYTVSTPWDVTTIKSVIGYDFLSQDYDRIQFSLDGTKMFGLRLSVELREWDLTTPFDVSSAVQTSRTASIAIDTAVRDFFISSDGMKLFLLGDTNDTIYVYRMNTPWAFTSQTALSAENYNFSAMAASRLEFSFDGTKMFIANTSNSIWVFELSKAWNPSSAVFLKSISINTSGGFKFSWDGYNLFTHNTSGDIFTQYKLDEPWIGGLTIIKNENIFGPSSSTTNLRDFCLNYDGRCLYVSSSIDGADRIASLRPLQFDDNYLGYAQTGYMETIEIDASISLLSPPKTLILSSDVNINDNDILYVKIQDYDNALNEIIISPNDFNQPIDCSVFTSTRFRIFVFFENKVFNTTSLMQNYSLLLSESSSGNKKYFQYDFFNNSNKIDSFTNTEIVDKKINLVKANTSTWDVTTATFDGTSFRVAAQETRPQGIAFKPDGTKMYIVGNSGDDVNPYTLGTPWDVTTATFDGTPFSVSAQDTYPVDISFKPDGTKMYILGNTGDDVNPYTLSTPWDVTTATFDGASFSVSGNDVNPRGIDFKPDGTKMYMIGLNAKVVFSYALSTPWDVTTASIEGGFSVSVQETNPHGITFKPDGTKMYISGSSGREVNPYTLGTPWDVTTATFDGTPFSVAAQDFDAYGIAFKPDGTKMYILGDTQDSVFEYNITGRLYETSGSFEVNLSDISKYLTSAPNTVKLVMNYDLKSGNLVLYSTFDGTPFSVSAQDTSPFDIAFKPDGTKMYILGYSGRDVNPYTLSTPWDVTTATFDGASKNVSGQEASPTGIAFKPDGTKMYIVGFTGQDVNPYTLATPWDVTTATFDGTPFSVAAQETNPFGMAFKPDGTKMYIVGTAGDDVNPYTLSTPWDVTTASFDGTPFSVVTQEPSPQGIAFNPDGTNMYIVGGNRNVFLYTLSTPWDVTTATFDGTSFSVNAQEANPRGITFKPDGTKMYILGDSGDAVNPYTLPTYNPSIDVSLYDGLNTFNISTTQFGQNLDCSTLNSTNLTFSIQMTTDFQEVSPEIDKYQIYFS